MLLDLKQEVVWVLSFNYDCNWSKIRVFDVELILSMYIYNNRCLFLIYFSLEMKVSKIKSYVIKLMITNLLDHNKEICMIMGFKV